MIDNSKLGYYLAPLLKIWLFMFFLLAWTIPVMLIASLNFLPFIPIKLISDILLELSLVLVVLGALLMMFKVFPNLNFEKVFVRKKSALPGFLTGSALGVIMMLGCTALIYISGNVSFSVGSVSWGNVLLYLLYFLLISIFEEFLFRTYTLYALAERYPIWFAILVSSLLFAFAHFSNPGITGLAVINITLAGVLFAIYTLQKQHIAWAVGVHFTWNFVQTIVLGYHVSGNKMQGLLVATPQGANFFSGGDFGMEGSIWCTLVLLLAIAWVGYRNGWGFLNANPPQYSDILVDKNQGLN